MELIFISILSLFIIPLISLHIDAKIKKEEKQKFVVIIGRYALYGTILFLIGKSTTLILSVVFGCPTNISSTQYIGITLISSVIMPIIFNAFTKKMVIEIKLKNEK